MIEEIYGASQVGWITKSQGAFPLALQAAGSEFPFQPKAISALLAEASASRYKSQLLFELAGQLSLHIFVIMHFLQAQDIQEEELEKFSLLCFWLFGPLGFIILRLQPDDTESEGEPKVEPKDRMLKLCSVAAWNPLVSILIIKSVPDLED